MQQLASVASSQLDKLIRRISAVVLVAVGFETLTNAAQQISLQDSFGVTQIAIFMVFSLLAVAALWFNLGPNLLTLHAVAVLVLAWCAVIQFGNPDVLGEEGRPWIWWAIGLTTILAAVFTNRVFATIYIPSISLSWFLVELIIFGEQRILQATLDSAYFVVFALAILGLVGIVRQAAERVDTANTEAIRSALEKAKFEAIERERQRLDALVHDQVLHTLLIAARAKTLTEQHSARTSAERAIESLEAALKENPGSEQITSSGLMSAIESSAQSLDSRVTVISRAEAQFIIPLDVAQALTESVMQALDNSIQHSSAKSIELNMIAYSDSKVLFQVEDDGIGFRVNRIPRDRLGIKTSIVFRMESVGGIARITSSPGNGTQIHLEWQR